MEGSWEHVSISETPDGPREPLEVAKNSWTFNADGTGTYSQKVMGRDMGSPFFWTLDGEKILLRRKKGGKTTSTYTVVALTETEMTWRNEKLRDYYHVAKR